MLGSELVLKKPLLRETVVAEEVVLGVGRPLV